MKSTPKENLPANLRKELKASPGVQALWKNLTPIARRDFISWIESAKLEETRNKRAATAISMLKAGKRRPCCYALVPMGLYKSLDALPKAKSAWKSLTPDEKRDFNDWIGAAKDPGQRQQRIEKTCALLLQGKHTPPAR